MRTGDFQSTLLRNTERAVKIGFRLQTPGVGRGLLEIAFGEGVVTCRQ